MTDVGWSKVALWLGVDHLDLNTIGRGTPDCEPAVVMVVVQKHHEALLAPNEERGSAMTQPFRGFGQYKARLTHLRKRLVDLIRRKPAHAGKTNKCARACLRNLLTMDLFDGLFDDETLLREPRDSPIAQAVADHHKLRAAYRSTMATLVVPDTQLTAVSRQLSAGVDLPVSVIPTGGAGGLLALAGRGLRGIDIVSVEPALRDLDDLAGSAARVASAAAALGPEIAVFVVLPYASGWEAAVELIEAAGLYGKIEAGGSSQTIDQLSILIEADLPFKVTGRIEGDWVTMLTVIHALVDGASREDAALLMADHDDDQSAAQVSTWDQSIQSRIRRRLRRVGTDRVKQVINDLAERGVPAAP